MRHNLLFIFPTLLRSIEIYIFVIITCSFACKEIVINLDFLVSPIFSFLVITVIVSILCSSAAIFGFFVLLKYNVVVASVLGILKHFRVDLEEGTTRHEVHLGLIFLAALECFLSGPFFQLSDLASCFICLPFIERFQSHRRAFR